MSITEILGAAGGVGSGISDVASTITGLINGTVAPATPATKINEQPAPSSTNLTEAQVQQQAAVPAVSRLPAWVVPAAVGGGVLALVLLFKKGK